MTLVFTTVFTLFELLFLCSWDCRIWGLRKTVFRCVGKLCACYRFQSYANRQPQPRLQYKTDSSWDFALMLTWSDRLPVTASPIYIIVEIGGTFERINSIVNESVHVPGVSDKPPNCFTTFLAYISLDCFARNSIALELWITYSLTCGNPYVPTSSALTSPTGAIPPCVWQAVTAFRRRILVPRIS